MRDLQGFGGGAAALNLRLRAVFAIVLAAMIGFAWPSVGVQAQVIDYGKLFGSGEPEAEPKQSRPLQTPAEPSQPTIADYGLVAESAGDPMLDRTRQAVSLFRERLKSIADELPGSWRKIKDALAAASPTGRPGYFVGIAVFAGLLLALGRAIMWIFAVYVTRRVMINLQSVRRRGYSGKLPVLAYRLAFTILGTFITLATATAVGMLFYQEHEASLITVIIVFASYGLVLVVDTIWRMAVAPYLSEARLPRITDSEARALYGWLSATSAFSIIGMAFCFWMQALGLSVEVHTALTVLVALGSTLMLLTMFRVHRGTISKIILAGRTRETASWLTVAAVTMWLPVVTAYLLFTWGDLSFRMIMRIEDNPLRLAAPYVIFMSGLIVYVVASYLIERIFARNREIQAMNAELDARRREEEEAETARLHEQITGTASGAADIDDDGDEEAGGPQVEETRAVRRASMQTMEDLARRTASLFAIGAVAYALIRFWGGAEIFEDTPALNLVEDIIDIVLVGYIIFHAVRIWIDQKIADEGGDEEDAGPMEGEGGGAGATRLATLLPLFRNFLLIVIAVTVMLLVAIEVGVNVAPLFAGAGIVGLAIGFGAQTLVRDILSGAFFLLDDAFRKGEYIDVGEVKGTVEKISLRSFQLRHHLGMLHTIPFGEIQHLTNFSRDWVMMKLPLRLTYDTDVEKVRKMIKKLGLRLLEDPEIGDKFIQPVKSQGVIMMDDSAMIVRIKFMTYPGEQWVLRKRIYAEIRELFEKEGIKFAHREVTVRIPDLDDRKELSEEQMKAIGAAARRVGDQADEEISGAATAADGR